MRWAREPPSGSIPPSWREPAFAPLFNGAGHGAHDVGELGAVMAGGPAYDLEMDAIAEAEAAQAAFEHHHHHHHHGPHGPHGMFPYVPHVPAGEDKRWHNICWSRYYML